MAPLGFGQQPFNSLPSVALVMGPYRALTPIVITRPNDVTPYSIGDVYGAAGDALITLPCAVPPGSMYHLRIVCVRHRNPVTGAGGLSFCFFPGTKPSTVIGDNALLLLSDADILSQVQSGLQPAAMTWSSAGGLNFSADPNGRCAAVQTCGPLPMPAGGDGNVYLYLLLTAAYTPIALEVLTLYPFLLVV